MFEENDDTLDPLARLADVQVEASAVEHAMSRVRQALAECAGEPSQPDPGVMPVLSKPAMRFTFLKWMIPLAAAAGVVLAVGLWPASKPAHAGRVYALSDVPELLRAARVLHARGYRLVPPVPRPGQEQIRVPLEYWIDTVNGRTRFPYVGYTTSATRTTVTVGEHVSDGSFEMEVDHTARTARFLRMGGLQRRLYTSQSLEALISTLFVDPGRVGGFTHVGSEVISGAKYELWQGQLGQGDDAMMIKCWLDPTSGRMARSQSFWNRGGQWVEDTCTEALEWGVTPPAGTFETQAPPGYALLNTKEAAPDMPVRSNWAQNSDLTWTSYLGFVLEDGSVIAGWSSADRRSESSQEGLFKDLVAGGPLPRLPIEVCGLKSLGLSEAVTYSGYHLACTQKAGQYTEWALYVPDRPPPANILGYAPVYRLHVNRPILGSINPGVPLCVKVNAGSFDAFVTAAMAELSDNHAAPAHVTYEAVTQLSQQVRAERP